MAQVEFLVRRKFFTLFGAAFHVYNSKGGLIGYSKQKAFKLKEDIRVFTDETQQSEYLSIQARKVVDFSASYDVIDSKTGEKLGALRRKGWASILRDSWEVLDGNDGVIGKIQEDSMLMALLRRFLTNLIPQSFHLIDSHEVQVAEFKQNFNPFVLKLNVRINEGCPYNPLLLLASGILLAAIEGRQK